MVYATRGLIDSLLRQASERDPEPVTISLAVTAGADLPEADLPPETPVFTHFYMPGAGGSVSAVFGVDLGTPPGQTKGRFVSHPDGRLELRDTDDLHQVVFVAVPPWGREDVAAFDRHGRKQQLEVLDVDPPEESADL